MTVWSVLRELLGGRDVDQSRTDGGKRNRFMERVRGQKPWTSNLRVCVCVCVCVVFVSVRARARRKETGG